jgi:hypothetical protein
MIFLLYLILILIICPITCTSGEETYGEPHAVADPELEKNPEPSSSSNVPNSGAPSESKRRGDGSSPQNDKPSSSSESSGSVNFFKNEVYKNSLEYPKKSISDRDDNIRKIYVEISSNGNENTTINVREFVDKNLSMMLPSLHGYVLSTPQDISLYKLGLLDELESNKSIKVEERNKTIYFSSAGYLYPIAKYKLYEINRLNDVLPYSRNKKPIFHWNKELRDANLSNYADLYSFLESDLMVNDMGNSSGLISCDNDYVTIKLNTYSINISKCNNKLIDNNSLLLEYNDITTHLRCNIKSNNSSNETFCNISVYNINDIIAFDNVTIPPGSMFVYWYYIVPKCFGTFQTETILFSNMGGSRGFHQRELDIENQPQFEVTPKVSESRIYIDDTLGLEFSVVYLGGGPQSSSGNLPVEFESDSDYFFVNEEGNPINPNETVDFQKDVSIPIKRSIKFKHNGIITVPGIWINKRHHMSNKDIIVDNYFSRYSGIMGSIFIGLMAVIVFFLGLVIKDIILCDESCKMSWRIKLENSWIFKKIIMISNKLHKLIINSIRKAKKII